MKDRHKGAGECTMRTTTIRVFTFQIGHQERIQRLGHQIGEVELGKLARETVAQKDFIPIHIVREKGWVGFALRNAG